MAILEEAEGQDAAAGTDTLYTVSIGDVFKGVLDGGRDKDWIRVELADAKPYQISLAGSGDNPDADLVLKVVNAAGEEVAANDDVDFAAGNLDAQVRFFLDEPGVHYIIVESYRGNPGKRTWGAYTLVLCDHEVQACGDDLVVDGAVDDVLLGTDADDELAGGEGDDWLLGGAGADLLQGGAGNDFASYRSSDAGVKVSLYRGAARGGHAEGDRFAGTEAVEHVDSADQTRAPAAPDIEHLVGSAFADVLEGSYVGNRLFGLEGKDELDGREGDDRLTGGPGDDRLPDFDGILR